MRRNVTGEEKRRHSGPSADSATDQAPWDITAAATSGVSHLNMIY